MLRSTTKAAIIACAILILGAATLSMPMPVIADQGGLQTAKIDPALLKAMQANPRGEFNVIAQTNMPNLKDKPDIVGAPSLKDVRDSKGNAPRDAKGNFDTKAALKLMNSQRTQWAFERMQSAAGKSIKFRGLSIVGGGASKLNADGIAKLSRDPFISYILLDKPMKSLGNPGDLSLYDQIIHAPSVWAQGTNGRGIGVAVIDSGVAAHDDLGLPSSRIIASTDLVTGSSSPSDPGGHGTHVAGIVAGNGTDSARLREGVAPGANIINVRVIDDGGSTNLSTVIAGIQWAIQNRRTYNIRVINLSLGAEQSGSYRDDPLASAVEMAWSSGLVVVTAAGNNMNIPGSIVTPGADPFVITVGALDDNETLTTADDSIAFFSSFGPTFDGMHKPDIVAPGRKIVSLRVPGSTLDGMLPERITDTNYFRLSGTSMAAPVVAGTAALMLQRNPFLNPNQVKYILMHTTQPVLSPNPDKTGAGLVDAYAAVNSRLTTRANLGLTQADNFAKSVYPMLRGMPLTGMWRNPTYQGINWGDVTWDTLTWNRTAWENFQWEDVTWDTITWTDVTWDNVVWTSATWDSVPPTGGAESSKWLSSKLN